jgi:hypothetical protein
MGRLLSAWIVLVLLLNRTSYETPEEMKFVEQPVIDAQKSCVTAALHQVLVKADSVSFWPAESSPLRIHSLAATAVRSKINAEVKDPVVLVLWVSLADGKLVARSHGPR